VRGHTKNPEFEIFTPVGRIVCECKRLHLGTGTVAERLSKIAGAFDAVLKTSSLGDGIRLEVEVVSPVRGDLSRIAAVARTAAAEAPLGHVTCSGPFLVVRSRLGQPPIHQNARGVWHGRVRFGDVPTGITEEYAYLLVSSPWMERALARAVGA